MKLSSKAISSPARTDKFPPPLMRFLRSNAGSRSRRSRSSPIFVLRKKNNNNNGIETTQEPSSPKVTCMGQVRARRSSKQSAAPERDNIPSTPTSRSRSRCRCWWIQKPNPCPCRPIWPKWAAFFRRKPTKLKEDSVKPESNFQFHEDDDEERVSVDNAFASNACTPPRNALLLTRCRSAPYRSSSLASRFWGSPLRSDEKETQSTCVDNNDKPCSLSLRESVSDSIGERIASSIRNSENVVEGLLLKEREIEKRVSEVRPVVLTRCKSEPARTGNRLDPEVVNSLLKKRRLGFADTTSSPRRLGFADTTSSPLHMLSD